MPIGGHTPPFYVWVSVGGWVNVGGCWWVRVWVGVGRCGCECTYVRMPVLRYVVVYWLKLRTYVSCLCLCPKTSLVSSFGVGTTVPNSLPDQLVPCMSLAMSHNQSEMDSLPPTPTTPSNESSLGDPSDDEATLVRRRENVLPVKITFVRAFLGELLGTHELRMDEDTSVGRLFALARQTPGTKPGPFCLTIRKQVLKDRKHLYLKMLEIHNFN